MRKPLARALCALSVALLPSLVGCGADSRSGVNTGPDPTPPAPKSGSIAVLVRGLPQGVLADLEVRGTNYSRTITDSTVLSNLPPGTYSLAARTVETARYRFSPDSLNRQIVITAAGEARVVVVEYTATSGQLVVILSGLRKDVTPSVTLAGPNGLAQQVTSSDTIWRLEAGSYTVTAQSAVRGNVRYVADTTTRTVSISSAKTTPLQIGYSALASFGVEITGLPPSVAADVDFIGPGGTRHLTSSATLSDLPLGNYVINARDVVVGLEVYRPSPSQSAIALTEDGPTTASVRYSRQSGRVALTFAGLPQNLGAPDASVATLIGPGGAAYSIAGSTTLIDLPMGDYELWASRVGYGGGAVIYQTTVTQSSFRLDPSHPEFTTTLPFSFLAGAYDVTFTNVPAGISPFLRVNGPGFTRGSNLSETVRGLQPGIYTLDLPITIGSNPTYYRNDPLPSSFTLSDATPRVRLTVGFHEMVWADVEIVVPGLPAGARLPLYFDGNFPSAPVTVPHIFPRATVIFAPGPAMIGDTAAWVTVDPTLRSPRTVTLEEGKNTLTFAVRQSNVVNVTTGLPGLAFPDNTIVLTGPNGNRLQTGWTARFTDVPPGVYTVTAIPAGAFRPTVTVQTITVPLIGHVDLNFQYTSTP